MGAELSCLSSKTNNQSKNRYDPNSSFSAPQVSMSFEAAYTPRGSSAPNVAQYSNSQNASVTRRQSASQSQGRPRSNQRFSFSDSVAESQEGQTNISMLHLSAPGDTMGQEGRQSRSMFGFVPNFSWRPSKNIEVMTSPGGNLFIDTKPEPSMLNFSETTPTGADAFRFPHFCPICYRHFADIYRTKCCGHNICYSCSQRHIESKRKLAKKLELDNPRTTTRANAELNINVPCPNCNSDNVEFERLRKGDKPRMYCESPTTKQLMERSTPQLTSSPYCTTPSQAAMIHTQ